MSKALRGELAKAKARAAIELDLTYQGEVQAVPRQLWFLRSKVTGFLEPGGFFTRKDARSDNKALYGNKFAVVGPYVLRWAK